MILYFSFSPLSTTQSKIMDPITTNICKTVVVPDIEYKEDLSKNALPAIEWFISTRYEVYGDERFEDPWIFYYYVYRMSVLTRESLLKFAMYIIGHLGVFAFLFQVFQEDRGTIMKICCYTQLGLLILCFVLYIASFVLDGVSLLMIKKEALTHERELRGEPSSTGTRYTPKIKKEVDVYHRIFGVRYFELNDKDKEDAHMMGEDEGTAAQVLNICFGLAMIVIECLTVAYVYNNTQ